jgi:eukaryotic-like serine/threonine-protein kinase
METVRSIGRYRIEGLLGKGAMGEVYRAHDPVIDRAVAIKVLRPELIAGTGSDQLLERFRREARAAGRRFHPNIVAIWDFGDDNGTPFLAMEFVDGRSLDQLIRASGRLEPGQSVAIITQVLSALGFAHEIGIVHRDVKPSNIMVLPNAHVKVADFGIARIDASEFTIVGDLLGTPAYMAPEQLTGGPVDHRTDLFAAGVILFEMLTGVKPFRGKSITDIMSFMEKRGPEDIRALNPAVPDALKRVITRSVAFDPEERFANAAEFSKAASETVTGFSGAPPTPGMPASVATGPGTRTAPVGRAAPLASSEGSLHPELSREIERDLATFIGPMASIALRRAVRETTDVIALYELLGRQVSNPRDRAEFLARGRQRAAAGLGQQGPSSPRPQRAARPRLDQPTLPPSPASIIAIQSDLTRYIGPIAKILVKRELEKFETLAKLCLVLAAHIPDATDRRAFLDAHGAK